MKFPLDKTWRFIQRMEGAVDSKSVETIIAETIEPLGLSTLFGGLVPTSVVPPEEIAARLLIQKLPEAWVERYNERQYLFRDPIVQRLQIDRMPFSWKEAYGSCRSRDDVQLIGGEAAEFGLNDGFVVPISLLDGSQAALSFGGADVELCADDRSLLAFVASCAVGHLLHQRASVQTARDRISAREYDCLLWAAEGKTDWEISVILGITQPTVAKHISSARSKLGAATRSHAIAIALRGKLIR